MKPNKERKMSRNSALKVIDHALSGKEGIENCEKFVEILGLRTFFPLFMKTPKRNKKSGHCEVKSLKDISSEDDKEDDDSGENTFLYKKLDSTQKGTKILLF